MVTWILLQVKEGNGGCNRGLHSLKFCGIKLSN
jgi:hypothetical protein